MFCSSCGAKIADSATFCEQCGAKQGAATVAPEAPGTAVGFTDNDKLLVILAHLGGIFFCFIPALVVYLVKKESGGWAFDNAREALNFQLTLVIGYVISFVLAFVLIGLLFFWLLALINLVLCIVATIKASEGKVYRYPVTLRLI